jgi:catechol 2,3-dioxygenase-like lactoylglutathione lyase family enzyme
MPMFHHCGLTVGDIERSYAFYTELAGMKPWDQDAELKLPVAPTHERQVAASGAAITGSKNDAFGDLTHNRGATIKFAMLQASDGTFILQLVEYLTGRGARLDLDHSRAGSPHFSFFVVDVEDARSRALRHPHATVTSEIVAINPGMRSFYASDPDGVPVEFLQLG